MTLYFDMDGTIANLYGVDGWLDYLIAEDATPYLIAEPLINLSLFARYLNQLQRLGINIGIVSWLAKNSNDEYDALVTEAKQEWLRNHLKSVEWDEIHIVKYGTPKQTVVNDIGFLFDDEAPNREKWDERYSYDEKEILETLKSWLDRLR